MEQKDYLLMSNYEHCHQHSGKSRHISRKGVRNEKVQLLAIGICAGTIEIYVHAHKDAKECSPISTSYTPRLL